MMEGLSIALREATFSLADSKAAQPLEVFDGVIPPPSRRAAGQGECSEPFAEAEPARAYAEFFGGLTNRKCALLLEHAHMMNLADKPL